MLKTANEAYAIHIGCMAGIDWNGCTIKFNIVVCSAIRGCPWLVILDIYIYISTIIATVCNSLKAIKAWYFCMAIAIGEMRCDEMR